MEKSFHGAFLTAFVQLSTCYGKAEHLMLLTLGKTPPFRCCCSSRLEQVRGSKIQHLIVKHKCLPDVLGFSRRLLLRRGRGLAPGQLQAPQRLGSQLL